VAPLLLTPKQPRGNRVKRKELTPKQCRFVDEYLKDLNATAAYRRTGYLAKTPSAIWAGACEILRNPKVQAASAVRRAAIEHRTQISQDQVRLELAHIAFFDPRRLFDPETGELMDVQKLPAEVAAVISSMEITQNGAGHPRHQDPVGQQDRSAGQTMPAPRDVRGQAADHGARTRA
jgi:phage terminase small subunit